MNIREAFIMQARRIVSDGYTQETHSKRRRQLSNTAFSVLSPLQTRDIEGIPGRKIPEICDKYTALEYFQSLFNTDKGSYDYCYGERIVPQVSSIVEKLSKYTNNAQIIVIKPDDHELNHRPCLQLIDFKRLPGNLLDMTVYFRSWDIFAMPCNLIGLSYLFELVAYDAELHVNHLHCYSSGLNCRHEMYPMLQEVVKYLQL